MGEGTADDVLDSLAASTSGKRDTPPRTSSPTPKPSVNLTELSKRVKQLYALPAIPMALRCPECAAHYAANCEEAADALLDLARTNKRVRRTLELLVQGGAYGELAITHGTLLVPILLHHDLIRLPAMVQGLFGRPAESDAPTAAHDHSPSAGWETPPASPTTVMPEEPFIMPNGKDEQNGSSSNVA